MASPQDHPPTLDDKDKPEHVVPTGLVRLPPDQYGQSHPIETDEVKAEALGLLEIELENLAAGGEHGAHGQEESTLWGVQRAKEKCPGLVESEEHRLMFLRCEMFNVDLAAKRMAKYWNRRIQLFGDDDAFADRLTLDGPLRNDRVALKTGFVRLLPGKDDVGRSLALMEPARLSGSGYTNESMGLIALINLSGAKTRNFDRSLLRMITDSLKGILPIRLSAIHMSHPPTIFGLIFPLIKFFLGERLRKRIRMHKGSEKKVLGELASVGVAAENVPLEFGGEVIIVQNEWLEQRKREGN